MGCESYQVASGALVGLLVAPGDMVEFVGRAYHKIVVEFVGRAYQKIVEVSGIGMNRSRVAATASRDNGTDLLQSASFDAEILLEDGAAEIWIFLEELIVPRFASYRLTEGSQRVDRERDRRCQHPL